MADDELTQILRRELAPIRDDLTGLRDRLDALEPQVAGIPLIHRAIEALREETRAVKIAVNELAAVQATGPEIEALHADVNKTITRQDEFEARLAVLERRVRGLQQRR